MKIVRVFGVLVWVGVLGVCFGQGGERPTAEELLRRYAKTQDSIYHSFVQKIRGTQTWRAYNPERGMQGDTLKTQVRVEVRSDGNSHFQLFNTWGDSLGRAPLTEDLCTNTYSLWNTEKLYQYTYHPSDIGDLDNGHLIISGGTKSHSWYNSIRDGGQGRELRGYFYGGKGRIDEEVMDISDMNVLPTMQTVNDVECFVVVASGRGCRYKLFISPERDYNIMHATIDRSWWTVGLPSEYSATPPAGESHMSLSDVRFRRIADSWVVTEARVDTQWKNELGHYFSARQHYNIEELTVNPDHDVLNSFSLSFVRDGALVSIVGAQGTNYSWRDGKVVDGEGKEVGVIDE